MILKLLCRIKASKSLNLHMALSQGTGSLQLQIRSQGFITYFQLK